MDIIKYIDRKTKQLKHENVPSSGMLQWFYNAFIGKAALHMLMKRKVISVLSGSYMNSNRSKKRIVPFITQHGVNLQECKKNNAQQFISFNDFFYRKLKKNARVIEKGIVSPADGKILVFPCLKEVSSFFIKGSEFNLDTFLKSKELGKKYKNGAMTIIRLAPADYHRFHFPYKGTATKTRNINGHYFSVSPIALKKSLRIFCENKRAYNLLKTDRYNDILIAEVGATMVGSIIQTYTENTFVKKGEEKGYFSFGGSTLVLLFENNSGIKFSEDLILNTQRGLETTIKMGETIAS